MQVSHSDWSDLNAALYLFVDPGPEPAQSKELQIQDPGLPESVSEGQLIQINKLM